ncbi:MAG: FIST C-terminal domain-containing protein [Treponema sp.]|nr:FIST C-terminal domain-containing protein [Treponema sp.]
MEQEVVYSRMPDAASAASELVSKLRKSAESYQAVFFMAAIRYDFAKLSEEIKKHFPNSEVMGASTAGEISMEGFMNDTVVLTTMSSSSVKVRGVLVEHGSKYPVACKAEIEKALQQCGIKTNDPNSHTSAFALAFINGVFNAEESILTNFYSIIKNDNFKLAGGTAGYTGNDPKTFVSYNGKTTQDGAAFMFVKTSSPFDIRQEDIFNRSGKTFFVSQADTVNRKIIKFDGESAQKVYAKKLGVSEEEAANMTFEHPFGRFLNGQVCIAALAGFTPSKEINLFARVVPNSTLELMQIGDPLEKCDETCRMIRSAIPHPKFVLMMTCITRTLAFARMNISREIISKYKANFPTFAGFSCYGEQLGRIHCNQTLVTLVMGD